MGVDPGGTTGVTTALVPRRATVADCMRHAKLSPYEVSGAMIDQSVRIALDWLDFVAKAQFKHRITIDRCFLAIESFQLRQRNVMLSPLEIHCALQGLLYQHDVNFKEQTPSQSKTFATDQRLRAWGCYVKGSTHKRDSLRHVALAVANQFDQDV
jgi:hypothetical protein